MGQFSFFSFFPPVLVCFKGQREEMGHVCVFVFMCVCMRERYV